MLCGCFPFITVNQVDNVPNITSLQQSRNFRKKHLTLVSTKRSTERTDFNLSVIKSVTEISSTTENLKEIIVLKDQSEIRYGRTSDLISTNTTQILATLTVKPQLVCQTEHEIEDQQKPLKPAQLRTRKTLLQYKSWCEATNLL